MLTAHQVGRSRPSGGTITRSSYSILDSGPAARHITTTATRCLCFVHHSQRLSHTGAHQLQPTQFDTGHGRLGDRGNRLGDRRFSRDGLIDRLSQRNRFGDAHRGRQRFRHGRHGDLSNWLNSRLNGHRLDAGDGMFYRSHFRFDHSSLSHHNGFHHRSNGHRRQLNRRSRHDGRKHRLVHHNLRLRLRATL